MSNNNTFQSNGIYSLFISSLTKDCTEEEWLCLSSSPPWILLLAERDVRRRWLTGFNPDRCIIEQSHRFSTPGVSTLTFPFHFLLCSHCALAPPDNDHPHMSCFFTDSLSLGMRSRAFIFIFLSSLSFCLHVIYYCGLHKHSPHLNLPQCVRQGVKAEN